MGFLQSITRFMNKTGPARFFIPLGVILIIFGAVLLGFKTDNFEKAVGTVTDVKSLGYEIVDGEQGQEQFEVSFTYNADGKEYNSTFEGYFGDLKAGDSIDVYYDPADPTRIANSKSGGTIGVIMIVAGVVALIAGVLLTIRAFARGR